MTDAAYDLLMAWGGPLSMSSTTCSLSERIRCVTTPAELISLWEDHKVAAAEGKCEPETIKSFIKSSADWGRRCAILAEPILYEIAQLPCLDLDDYTSLAVTTCDVNSRRLVELLLERTSGTRQYVAFYYSLLRCTAEFLRPVDMLLTTHISSLMAQHGIAMYIPHVRVLIHGFGRLSEPPLKALENIVDRVLEDQPGVPLDPSILHELLSIFERSRGRYAKHALSILQKIGLDSCAKLVSSVYVKPADYKHDKEKAFTTFYVVDPYAFPLERVPLPPPLKGKASKWFILFLYSSVRGMIEFNGNFSSGNQFLQQKLDMIKSLTQREPHHVFVFPVDVELQFRAAGRDGIVDDNPNSRYISFLESFVPQFEDPTQVAPQEAQLVFITQNAMLKRQLEQKFQHLAVCPISVQSDF